MTERWVKMVKKAAMSRVSETDPNMIVQYLYVPQVVKLLARQHRAAVNKVKAMLKEVEHVKDAAHFVRGERHAYQQVLAALATQGGGKK